LFATNLKPTYLSESPPSLMRLDIRREALERLATLSASNPLSSQIDISRLSKRCPGPRSSSSTASPIPITLPELEALLALCKAANQATTVEVAAQFLPQISSYLPHCHSQSLHLPLSFPHPTPSPWESLSYNLAAAVLSLGSNHPSLRQHASTVTARYVSFWLEASQSVLGIQLDTENEHDESTMHAIGRTVTLAMSLLGFLDAAAANAEFWTPHERLHVVRILRDALSEEYMISLETALSIIRNSRVLNSQFTKWKHYSRRYATSGRPLGAMLLRLGFMRLVCAFASLEVARSEDLSRADILELLLSEQYRPPLGHASSDVLLEQLAEISADELKLLEDGSDYLQLGSAWQRRLASAVKANAFTCLLCCAIADDEIAEPDALLQRLENTMADQAQILDDYLASVVFKSMAILAKSSPTLGSVVTRSLSKTIVQGRFASRTASVVAECLASVLKRLPQDATITTLYSLGNALSTSSRHPEKNISASPSFDVAPKHHRNPPFVDQSGGSVVSFGPSIIDEPSLVYLTTIEAIVRIAFTCGEDKIIALALSMLIQKIGRLSLEVDAKIITETSILGVHSAVSELRSLLKLYSKLCHDALVEDNTTLLDAVGIDVCLRVNF
jgi:phosphatidylinositol 4-kinase A